MVSPASIREQIALAEDYHVQKPDSGGGTSLWDTIDSQWTAPMPPHMVSQLLKKVVMRCSDCTFASARRGHVGSHIRQERQKNRTHVEANEQQIFRFVLQAPSVTTATVVPIRTEVNVVPDASQVDGVAPRQRRRRRRRSRGKARHGNAS